MSAPGPSIYRALGVPGGKSTGEGEDCLVLNVWTPALNDSRKRPVMLWLHGGGFRGGSGSNPGWDGTNLCLRGDVVVITINLLIASDHSYGAKTMKVAERRAALGKGPVYLYYFAWETPVPNGLLKSPHNLEWPSAFDNAKLCANLTGGGPEAVALADKVSDAWIAFARTGNPNTAKLPPWPVFTDEDRATMVIDNASKIVNDPLREQRIAMFRALNLT
jgi:carboxylesterase type B